MESSGVPDELNELWQERAAGEGVSLSEFVIRELSLWHKPVKPITKEELPAFIASRPPIQDFDSAAVIRELRGPLPDDDGTCR